MSAGDFYEQVYAVVRAIPPGRVTSYGRIAHMLGRPRAARAVGYALNALKGRVHEPSYSDIPWHRVLNAHGRISIVNRDVTAQYQAERLRAEGVIVTDALTVNLDVYLWGGLALDEIEAIFQQHT